VPAIVGMKGTNHFVAANEELFPRGTIWNTAPFCIYGGGIVF